MHEKDLYEYAIIRLVPRVEREEFFNVGLVMFCKRKQWLKMAYHLSKSRFDAFPSGISFDFVIENLEAFQHIAHGQCTVSPIAKLDAAERFRWLTATRSSSLQTSKTHVGKTEDLQMTFDKIFKDHIL